MNTFNINPYLDRGGTDCLKAICMLMIIVHHAYQIYWGNESHDTIPYSLSIIYANLGYLATGVFFFISGYGMHLSLVKKSPINRSYIWGKVKKLFEPYLSIYVVFAIFGIFGYFAISHEWIVRFLTLSTPTSWENWFFRVILATYILIMFIYSLPLQLKTKVAIVCLSSLIYVTLGYCIKAPAYWYVTHLNFAFGILVAYYPELKEFLSGRLSYILSGLLFIIAFLLNITLIASPILRMVISILFTIAATNSIRIVGSGGEILQFISTYSLYFYFIQDPVYRSGLIRTNMNFYLYVVLIVIMTYLIVLGYVKAKSYIESYLR